MATQAPPAAPSLRERKKQRTRRDLQEAAFELFAAKGFDHVTCDDIAAAAEVSKTTFYRYFDSKEDVLLGNVEERTSELAAALDAQPPDLAAMPALREAVARFTEAYEQDRDLLLAKGELVRATPSLAARSLEHQAMWEDVLARFLAGRAGLGDADSLRVRVLAASTMVALRVAMARWQASGGREDIQALLSEALDVVEAGFPS